MGTTIKHLLAVMVLVAATLAATASSHAAPVTDEFVARQLADIIPEGLTPIANGGVFFHANDGTHGREPWVSDGTAAGTVMLRDINPGADSSNPSALWPLGSGPTSLFFADGADLLQLWSTNGTPAGTRLIAELAPLANDPIFGSPLSRGSFLGKLGARLLFSVREPSGLSLWTTDGTTAGTRSIVDFAPSHKWTTRLAKLGPNLLFLSAEESGLSLWSTDGTTAGTTSITRWNWNSIPIWLGLSEGVIIDGAVLFWADIPGEGDGDLLWRTDGTATGTYLVKDIIPGDLVDSQPGFVPLGDAFLFRAYSARFPELWVTDGTEAGTTLLRAIGPRAFPGWRGMVRLGDHLYFDADDGRTGRELWVTDGTTEGTDLVIDLNPGFETARNGSAVPASSFPQRGQSRDMLAAVDDRLLMGADDGTSGLELWSTDGTEAGTTMVTDINPGPLGSDPRRMISINSQIFFVARTGPTGDEIWRTDGTEAGTEAVADINPGPESSHARGFTQSGNTLFFTADDGIAGRALWAIDVPPPPIPLGPCAQRELVPTHLGSDGPDVIFGTPERDVIVSFGGDDVIYGLGGHDLICAGPGNDRIFAGAGNDRIYGDGGIDKIRGGAGNDTIHGGDHLDFLKGGAGDDWILGEGGFDRIRGSDGDDNLHGGAGADVIWGGPGNDRLLGQAGNDILKGGDGINGCDGGPGIDVAMPLCQVSIDIP